MIDFQGILVPASVRAGVDARTRKAGLEEACQLLKARSPALDARALLAGLMWREQLGSTGLGEGVAIPHCRFEGCTSPMAALLRTVTGIDFDGPDEQPVDLLFVLAVPQADGEQRAHLELLGALARAFDDPANLSALRSAASDQELHDAMQDALLAP